MEVNAIIDVIEKFAPIQLQEKWDCSGIALDFRDKDINKVLLCLSVTKNIIEQAIQKNCDMIISHHPLFFIPLEFNAGLPVYCAHTNLDKADGGTTDTLIELLGFGRAQKISDFLRLIELQDEISVKEIVTLLKTKLNILT